MISQNMCGHEMPKEWCNQKELEFLFSTAISVKNYVALQNLVNSEVGVGARGNDYLNFAVIKGDISAIDIFLQKVDINAKGRDGRTALQCSRDYDGILSNSLNSGSLSEFLNSRGAKEWEKKSFKEDMENFSKSFDKKMSKASNEKKSHSSGEAQKMSKSAAASAEKDESFASIKSPSTEAAIKEVESLNVSSARDVRGKGKPSLNPTSNTAAAAANDNSKETETSL